MENQFDKFRVFSRRAFLLGAGQLLLLGGLGARLGQLQIENGEKYKTLSDKNRIDLRLTAPSRGLIFDRKGAVLASNQQNFRLLVTAEQVANKDILFSDLKEFVNLSNQEVQDILERMKDVPKFIPVEVVDRLSWEEVSKIELNLPDLPGVQIDVGEYRQYPFSADLAHIVGYVSSVSRADLRKSDAQLLRLPGIKIGKIGIERQYEEHLRGQAGTKKIEVNVSGREVRELSHQKSKKGSPVVLTIDSDLQRFTQKKLSEHKSAASVIMDAKTGAIYALGSHPSYDTNLFLGGLTPEKWQALLSDPTYPLSNKAVAGQYPPGSTFKMVTALAALEKGKIRPNHKVTCSGVYELGKDLFHCWKRGGHGSMDVIEALSQSCDTYFYQIATEIGIDPIHDMALRLGLGERLDFDLKEERPGLIPNENWKLGHIGAKWQKGETVVASIGQGYIQATPLQLATMCTRLVNGGYAVKPWITETVGPFARPEQKWEKIGLKSRNLKLMMRGMERAVNHEKGTAFSSKIEGRMAMGGKTGTAQVKRITMAQREAGLDQEAVAWRSRHHALFVGYAPLIKPRYVCATVVEHGIGGSRTAAPLTKELLLKAQQLKPAEMAAYLPEESA